MATFQPGPEVAAEGGAEGHRDAADEIAEAAQSTQVRSQRPTSEAFKRFIAQGWAPRPGTLPALLPGAAQAAGRRERLSAMFPGDRLVVPAGSYRIRSNDTEHRFRAHTAFAYLTGLGGEREPDSVLVLEPRAGGGHDALLHFRPRAGRDTEEFYSDSTYGELWVGARQSLEEVAAETGLRAVALEGLDAAVTAGLDAGGTDGTDGTDGGGRVTVRLVADASPALAATLGAARLGAGVTAEAATEADEELARAVSTMRLVKEPWEVDQLRQAVAATAEGFDDVVAALPATGTDPAGERAVEVAFAARARSLGNGLGYDVIAAGGANACTLHYIRNDGPVRAGELLLVDAGVELDSLYTADVTRTLPVGGRFSPAQRQVYEAVLDAADAAMAEVRPGARLADVHEAAMRVLAERLDAWGLLPVGVDEALDRENGGQHRRWCVHGTSHHLGLDVHDCSLARREEYVEGELRPGMVFTVEPGLYVRPDDELAPPELRGIGVRIEDDVLVTEDGVENLTAALPRRADEVEAWVATGRRPARH